MGEEAHGFVENHRMEARLKEVLGFVENHRMEAGGESQGFVENIRREAREIDTLLCLDIIFSSVITSIVRPCFDFL